MQTVGEFLRAERIKKALSIKDVESAISIRALYLNAIEEGNYAIIPGEVYLKGFIRNYATFLGLDPKEVMELYRQNKGQTNEEASLEKPQVAEPVKPSSQSNGLMKWVSGIALAAIIVAGVTWWFLNKPQPSPTPPPQAAQQQTPAKVPAGPQVPSANQPAPTPTPATKVVVTAKFSAPCWTQIIADGKAIYEGTPKNGESLTWEAANKLSVKFGNAGVVDLVYNGKPVGKIGNNGEVVVKTFTLTGITQ